MQQQMPVAPNEASQLPHQLPTAPSCASDGGLLACGYRGGPCPALATLFRTAHIEGGEESREWVQKLSPCGSCRVAFESQRAALRGLRLGQRERDILVAATRAPLIDITTADMTRSISAARRRAAQSLIKAGLLAGSSGPRGRARAAMTPLGRYVMAAYGRFIETGKPVRWDRPSSKVALPGRAPEELLRETLELTQTALKSTLSELNRVLFAAVARPVKNPSQLSEIADRLEKKAEGLKTLLAAKPALEAQVAPSAAA